MLNKDTKISLDQRGAWTITSQISAQVCGQIIISKCTLTIETTKNYHLSWYLTTQSSDKLWWNIWKKYTDFHRMHRKHFINSFGTNKASETLICCPHLHSDICLPSVHHRPIMPKHYWWEVALTWAVLFSFNFSYDYSRKACSPKTNQSGGVYN